MLFSLTPKSFGKFDKFVLEFDSASQFLQFILKSRE